MKTYLSSHIASIKYNQRVKKLNTYAYMKNMKKHLLLWKNKITIYYFHQQHNNKLCKMQKSFLKSRISYFLRQQGNPFSPLKL